MEKLLDCLAFGRDERTYNEDIRSFCLTLHYYSPRAYNYVRTKFNNHLPSVSAIKKWYASVCASPGLENDSFDILQKKSNEYKANNKVLICCLIKDEMAIRRQSQWNPHKSKFEGFVDMGQKLTSQDILPLAKEALVFLVSGVEEDFKIPLAYYFINSLDTQQSAFVTIQILTRLSEIGVEITSLTMDGHRTNIAMCKFLGANFYGKAYICDPLDEKRSIYIFLDPPHMLKLARNCLASRNLVDGKGRKLEWRYIEMLYDAQINLASNLGNKLTKAHLQWEKRKMNVQLAAQTLSNSVADSLEFLQQECEQFRQAGGTAEYARTVNNVFDIMNTTKSEGANGFKRPISRETHTEFSERFEQAIEYIKGLRVESESGPILSSISSTPFIGMLNNMINFMSLYKDYILTDKIKSGMLITHRFSQDHIETLFGCIRSMNGFNDNPTVQQFEAAFRKLLVHNDIVCPKKSNCIESGTKVLTVSSHRPRSEQHNQSFLEHEIDAHIFEDDFECNFYAAHQYIDDAHGHSLAFRASMLEDKIIKAKKPKLLIKCEECVNTFVENELLQDSFIRFKSKRSNIMQPCKSTFEICKFVDSFLKCFQEKTISFDAALLQILRKIPFETLYTSSNFESHAEMGHKYEFVKQIVKIYMDMKSVQSAHALTLKTHENPIRHNLKKMIQRAGQ